MTYECPKCSARDDFSHRDDCDLLLECTFDVLANGAYMWGWYDEETEYEYYFMDTAGTFVVC